MAVEGEGPEEDAGGAVAEDVEEAVGVVGASAVRAVVALDAAAVGADHDAGEAIGFLDEPSCGGRGGGDGALLWIVLGDLRELGLEGGDVDEALGAVHLADGAEGAAARAAAVEDVEVGGGDGVAYDGGARGCGDGSGDELVGERGGGVADHPGGALGRGGVGVGLAQVVGGEETVRSGDEAGLRGGELAGSDDDDGDVAGEGELVYVVDAELDGVGGGEACLGEVGRDVLGRGAVGVDAELGASRVRVDREGDEGPLAGLEIARAEPEGRAVLIEDGSGGAGLLALEGDDVLAALVEGEDLAGLVDPGLA